MLRIEQDMVEIEQGQQRHRLANDAIIVCAGGILPDGLLRDIGISIETKNGTA